MSPFTLRVFALGAAMVVGVAAPAVLTAETHRQLAQAKNPCGAKNPCAAKNPCGASGGVAVKDPAAQAAFKQYKTWKKVNTEPVLSATHGNRYVFTYVNKTAAPIGEQGKFPFPAGSVLVKESFEGQAGKPGEKGPVFVMEKRKKGYDPANGDWHYAMLDPAGAVQMSGSGKAGAATNFCAACHQSAKANDYVFGTGTTMKVKPVVMGAAPANPCAAKNPCAAGTKK